MKVVVVAGVHGDEVFGLKVLGYLSQAGMDLGSLIVAHPEAIAKRTRFIDTDLNRSFSSSSDSQEAKLAGVLVRRIEKLKPDILLDLHTSRSDVTQVGIVANLSDNICQVAHATGMESVVKMPNYLTKHSLIGQFPHSISLEFGKGQRSDKLARQVADNIMNIKVKMPRNGLIPRFEVIGEISKSYKGLDQLSNLKYNRNLRGYPFLAGPDTYEKIGGFLAKRIG